MSDAIDAKMQELNDAVSKAHAEQDEFRQRTQCYWDVKKLCEGHSQDLSGSYDMQIIIVDPRTGRMSLDCTPSLAAEVWLTMGKWLEKAKASLVLELTAGE